MKNQNLKIKVEKAGAQAPVLPNANSNVNISKRTGLINFMFMRRSITKQKKGASRREGEGRLLESAQDHHHACSFKSSQSESSFQDLNVAKTSKRISRRFNPIDYLNFSQNRFKERNLNMIEIKQEMSR